MLEGTIRLVRICSGYAALDRRGKGFGEFLTMQTYDPAKTNGAQYAYTFDIFRMAFARILVGANEGILDLADIYGSPWHEYEVVGFDCLWVSRPDWSPLSKGEAVEIETTITEDFRFDYTDDEIDIWCDDSLDETYLFVSVQDVPDDDDFLTTNITPT